MDRLEKILAIVSDICSIASFVIAVVLLFL